MTIKCIGLAIVAVLTAGSVRAEDGVVRVHIGDLDLARPSDLRTAHDRIQMAAENYCVARSSYPIGSHSQSCRREIVEKATNQLMERQAQLASRLASR
ncbi:UrcA family protein [Phenylobacterium sp.]|jgi:UrcA family protein|uniref:UrcA family protein n=1 Tax=Phenylobacterium sp. TaxID=1871053 RepID=UPI002E2F589B|nr:UrcA family protein [Phenylobacterium sp.]HEX3363789.1 UrcA family protein [Phenylobacterium sp.]